MMRAWTPEKFYVIMDFGVLISFCQKNFDLLRYSTCIIEIFQGLHERVVGVCFG